MTYSIPISGRSRHAGWRGLLFIVLFNLGILTVHTTQILVLVAFGWPWSRNLYKNGIRYTKGSFGALLVLMCQWFAPTTLHVTFEMHGKGKFTPEACPSRFMQLKVSFTSRKSRKLPSKARTVKLSR
ncbi:hypothetical protein C8F01DRAFT_1008435 [Mycena amicta]|nr:hypothetical protein C8F01DRAFT_1008435 [Mycena amicta]